jgi:uncharacterized membrane protein (UPF0127 family)
MMLYKTHNQSFLEDFGMLNPDNDKVFLYEAETSLNLSSKKSAFSPVIKVKALWLDRNLKVSCNVADTEEKRIAGLQPYSSLPMNHGMYFPYLPYTDVSFHQGKVAYPLDIIFMRDEYIVKIVQNTKVGSTDPWSCEGCSGVIEVNGGFCNSCGVSVGDRIALCAVSERDVKEVQREKIDDSYVGDFDV